jgi:hypothetical protein
MTFELDVALRRESIEFMVVDDADDDMSSYLGSVQVPLAPLADGFSIDGDFQLISNSGTVGGTISVKVAWAHPYEPGSAEGHHDYDAPTPVSQPLSTDLPFDVEEEEGDQDKAPSDAEVRVDRDLS